jgi:predicted nucleic acid-binding protein
MRLLLDTSVLIDALRLRHRRRELLAELVQAGHTLATTALNVAEVYAGMLPNEAQRTEAFLGALECHDLTATSGRRAGALKQQWGKKGRTLALADMIVAAIALELGCTLMTDNRKDFPMQELDKFELSET